MAVGGGFDIALACDMRVGCYKSGFMVAYTRMAVTPDLGGVWLMTRVMGIGKALELIFTGDVCTAEEAYRIGVLNRLVTHDKLEEETMDLATKIAKGPPLPQRLAKPLCYKGLQMDLETALQFLSASLPIVLKSRDHQEAIAAFAERREPKFEGK